MIIPKIGHSVFFYIPFIPCKEKKMNEYMNSKKKILKITQEQQQ